jgi:hypothetical protein
MKFAVPLMMTAALAFGLTGCGTDAQNTASEAGATDKPAAQEQQQKAGADLGQPQSITIRLDGNSYDVPSGHETFANLTAAAEESLNHTTEVCKCVFQQEELTSVNSVVIVLPEAKPVKAKANIGDVIPISHVIVPLSGKNFDQHIISTGSETGLGGYKTEPKTLETIKSLAQQFVKSSK